MSLTRKTATYAGSAMIIAIVVILAATIYVGAGNSLTSSQASGTTSIQQSNSGQSQTLTQSQTGSSTQGASSSQASSQTSQNSPNSLVLVQLTDPPTVPAGTTSLNLTYSAITLLVGEPGTDGQVTTTTVNVVPTGGSATVDLLRLENVTMTIASANLPSGSSIYSATFTVSSIAIEIDGTSSPVTLATGGTSFAVTLTQGTVVSGTNAVLLDLNPTVVSTPTGYQLIPSSVGIMRSQSEITQQSWSVGWQGPLTGQDWTNLRSAQGQVTADLLDLSASGSTTTVTVEVNNTGTTSVGLFQVGLSGGLTVQSDGCATSTSTSSASSSSASTTSTSTTSTSSTYSKGGFGQGQNFNNNGCWNPGQFGQGQLLFTPTGTSSTTSTSASSSSTTTSTSTSTSTSCATGQMALSDGLSLVKGFSPLVLGPGQCVILTFTGTITYGHGQLTFVPSTASGEVYQLNVVASNFAQASLSCTLPTGPISTTNPITCTPVNGKNAW